MGTVEVVGPEVTTIHVGDGVVVPFTNSCGHCFMCRHGLQSQCETTRARQYGTGAAPFGYTKLYGRVPGGQAEYVRVPQAQYGPVVLPQTGRDERWLYLHPADRASRTQIWNPATPSPSSGSGRWDSAIRDLTGGRGADRVRRGGDGGARLPDGEGRHRSVHDTATRGDSCAQQAVGVDRIAALKTAFGSVRCGGTVSLSGVYGGSAVPVNLMRLFDRQVTIRMGQANVRRWTDHLLRLVSRDDVFDVERLASHHLPLEDAPDAYRMFRAKTHDCIKVVLHP